VLRLGIGLTRPQRLATLLVTAAATATAAAPAAQAAKPLPPVPPPIQAPQAAPEGTGFDGDGMWIWYVSQSGRTAANIADKAIASGVETVFIKSSDAGSYWSQFNSKFVADLKARGLKVCAWQYVYGRRPTTEARQGRRAAQNGADCLVIDAETEYEGKYASASTYMRKLRAYLGPDYPIGLAGYPYVDYHPAYPYSVFLGPGGAQFNVPQMYWRAIGVSVDTIYQHTYLHNQLYGRPIYPLGQLYQRPPRSQILRFRQMAFAYGARGVSWWSWQSASANAFRVLAEPLDPIAAQSAPGPVAPTLTKGAKGDRVVWAQQHLLAAGQSVKVNGVFDTRTKRAVRAFQQASALPVTGALDPPTWQSLLANPPAKVRWAKAGRASRAKRAMAQATTPPPLSATLPARANEIPRKRHR
jgi:hypothetical protein